MTAVPIVCPECGATYTKLKLDPGAEFACGECSHTLHVPGAAPTRNAQPPVVMPTRPGTPPKLQPRRTGAPPPVQPRQPPVVQPAPPAARAPAARPGATAPRGPVVQPAIPAPNAARQPAPRARTVPRGKTTRRPHTAVIREDDLGSIEPRGSNKGLILAGIFGGVALVTLVGVLIAVSGTSEEDRDSSYAAGYMAALDTRIGKALRLPVERTEDYAAWAAVYEGSPSQTDFLKGVEDGRRGREPARAAKRVEGVRHDPEPVLEALKTATQSRGDDAQKVWILAGDLDTLVQRWKQEGADATKLEVLERRQADLLDRVLSLDPDHAEARLGRGEVKYTNDLEEFIEAEYLDDAARTRARRTHESLQKKAARNNGWLKPRDLEPIAALRKTFADKKAEWDNVTSSPFYTKAVTMKEEVHKDLLDTLRKAKENYEKIKEVMKKQFPDATISGFEKQLEQIEGREYEAVIRKPYVVFVEVDDQWDQTLQAEEAILKPLVSLNNKFLEKYGTAYGLAEPENPIPVVFMRSRDAYQQYCLGKHGGMNPGAIAHFEPDNGRIVLYSETKFTTTLHEGTHQLFWHYMKNAADFAEESYWLQEGAAEWFAGAKRTVNKDTQDWDYEIGLLQENRFKGVKGLFQDGKQYKLQDLIELKYGDRGKLEGYQHALVYAQGWMLMYFLNYFDVTEDGLVKIDTKKEPVTGKYQDVFKRMLEFVLKGKDGKPFTGKAAFLEAAGVKSVDELEPMAKEFDAYQRFILRKIDLRHIKDKRLIPYDEYRNKRSEASALRSDDLLHPPEEPDK